MSIVPMVSPVWLLPAGTFIVGVLVVSAMLRRLSAEMRSTAAALNAVATAVVAVHGDLRRARAALDSLELPALRRIAVGRALGATVRIAARRAMLR